MIDDDMARRIGDNIKVLRAAKSLSQDKLASRAGISLSTLRIREKGDGRPQYRTLEKIAKALGVKPEQLASLQSGATGLNGKTEGENFRPPDSDGSALEFSQANETQSLLLAKDEMDELAALIAGKLYMMNRREMMQGITASALAGIGVTDVAQSIQYGLNGRKVGGEVAEWAREQVTNLKWLNVRIDGEQLYAIGRSNLILLQTLLQMRAASGEDERELRLALAQMASQVGYLAEDAAMFDQAAQHYHFGVEMARSAGGKDHAIYCLTRLATVDLSKGKPRQCLSRLEFAQSEAGEGSYWHDFILTFAVEAYGRLGDERSANQILAKADALYERGTADRMSEWVWSVKRPSLRAATTRAFLSLNPRFAIKLSEDAIAETPMNFLQSRLHIMAGLARAKLDIGEIDEALKIGDQVLQTVVTSPTPRIEKSLAEFHAKLPDDPIATEFKERYTNYVQMRKPSKLS